MKAEKIFHRNEPRIKIDFPYNQHITAILQQISDAKWSQTYKAWHIPYNTAAFKQLITLFPEIEYEKKKTTLVLPQTNTVSSNIQPPTFDKKGIYIEVIARKIIIKLPKNEVDIKFINTLKYSKWDSKQYCWVGKENFILLTDHTKKKRFQ